MLVRTYLHFDDVRVDGEDEPWTDSRVERMLDELSPSFLEDEALFVEWVRDEVSGRGIGPTRFGAQYLGPLLLHRLRQRKARGLD